MLRPEMSHTLQVAVSSFTVTRGRDGSVARPRDSRPGWAFLVFVVVVGIAYSPGLLNVFSVLADFDALSLKNEHFFFHNEAAHLVSIARPVAALLSNLAVPFVQSPEDFRWVHLFSFSTICILGWQMIRLCVGRLQVSPWDALAVALATFLGLAFIYAVLEATAWAPHLFTPFLAFWSYSVLSRSNVQTVSFLGYVARRDYRDLTGQLLAYCAARPVWIACLIYQFALYSYPPHALLIVLFPAIAVLFSGAPAAYRRLTALRDVLFVGANLVFYSLSTALIYLPIVRLFTTKGSGAANAYESEYVANLYAAYRFAYNHDVAAMAHRLGHLMRVSGDLWLLPQTNMYIVTAGVFVLGLLTGWWRKPARGDAAVIFVLGACFAMAAAPILASAGGFVAYRTSVATTALTAILFVFAIRSLAEWLWARIGGTPVAAARAGGMAMALTVGVAFAGNAYANYAVMRLGRSEYAYFTHIVRQAIDNKSKAIVLIDPRPWSGAHGYNQWPVFDEKGRAVPPFELGCFSSFCMQTGAIVRVIATELGLPDKDYKLVLTRGDDPVPGLTCEMVEASAGNYPPNASQQSIELVDHYRSLTPLTCATETTSWHDLGLDLSRQTGVR